MSKKIVTTLPPTPIAVKEGSANLKTFYFWALNKGQITASMDDIAELLGFERASTSRSYKALKKDGLLNELVEASGSAPATFEITDNKKTD